MLSFHAAGKDGIEAAMDAKTIPSGVNWIDAVRPDAQDIAFLKRTLGIEVPTLETLSEIETSSRLRSAKDWLYLSIPMIHRADGFMPALTPLGFVLSQDILLTVRFEHMKAFDDVLDTVSRHPMQAGGPGALIAILEAIVDHAADVLEGVGGDLDCLSEQIFGTNAANAQRHKPREDGDQLRLVLRKVGRNGDLTSKIEDLLLGMARMVPYVAANATPYLEADIRAKFKSLQRDIASLNDYETHLTDKIQFLLDATLGLTNIDQNNIFRILTVVSVIGIPPTFVASMYGMNFKNIPEYDWAHGYQYGLLLIALSAIVPIIWFKWRGWW
ncbi:MAG: magnesium transporter CorA family protein [Pseudomonadota bacterium]|nr:magnesium transporter CorA family protein [Pseudomonadota bacterium]